MKKTIIKTIAISTFLLVSSFAFADNWYICVGSFKEKINADQFQRNLENKNVHSFSSEYLKNGTEKYYRILLDESFPTKEKSLEVKRQLDQNKFLKSLGINNIWCTELPEPSQDGKTAVKEVVVEKVVEVVKEVEVIKEVPVEVEIIKEVPVEVEVVKEVVKEVQVPVEIVKEVVKTVPVSVPVEVEKKVEVVKEVEVIKEVPVEKIIETVRVISEEEAQSQASTTDVTANNGK